MDEEIERKILVTESGQQIPVQSFPGLIVQAFIPGDPVVEEVSLDVTDKEFAKLRKQAMTNDIPAAILSSKKAD